MAYYFILFGREINYCNEINREFDLNEWNWKLPTIWLVIRILKKKFTASIRNFK
jgi:hypothetical protein